MNKKNLSEQDIRTKFITPAIVEIAGWVPDRIYNLRDFDRQLVIDNRTQSIANRITEFLKKTDRFSKSIIFCEDIEHAERMRQAVAPG